MLAQEKIVRAWKDPLFRAQLSSADLDMLPANPAGLVELTDDELMEVDGGTGSICASILIGYTISLSPALTILVPFG